MTVAQIKATIDDIVVRYEDGLISADEAKNLIISAACESYNTGEE